MYFFWHIHAVLSTLEVKFVIFFFFYNFVLFLPLFLNIFKSFICIFKTYIRIFKEPNLYNLILFDFVWMFLYLSPCFIRIICKLHATVSRSCSWKLIKMSSDIYIKKRKGQHCVCVRVCLQPLGQLGHNRAFLLNLWPLESCMGSLWEDKKKSLFTWGTLP